MSQPRTKPTISEVAAHAGVSIGTVSRVLNGLDRVHPDTRRRVQHAIAELRYHPSAMARGLALQRTQTIGLIIPSVTDPFFSEMVRGVEDASAAASYSVLIRSRPWDGDGEGYQRLFTTSQVDGLVLVAINVRRAFLDQLVGRGFPVAVIQEDLGGHVPTFIVDNYGGARALAEHLVGHGYRRIGYIAGSGFTPDSAERLRALQDVLAEHGHTQPAPYIVRGDYTRGSGYQAMCELLDLPDLPEAVFAANDQMAADALRAIRERGLRVPDDIALAGFDDIALASYTAPPLTTVRQPTYEMGRLALEAVLAPVPPTGEPPRVVLPTELIIRESCGCRTRPASTCGGLAGAEGLIHRVR